MRHLSASDICSARNWLSITERHQRECYRMYPDGELPYEVSCSSTIQAQATVARALDLVEHVRRALVKASLAQLDGSRSTLNDTRVIDELLAVFGEKP
jgi:hypothetical protein